MKDLLLITMPYEEFKELITKTVEAAVKNATAHLQPIKSNEFLTRNEVSKFFGITLVALHEWTKQGKLIGYKVGSRVMYKKDEIEKSLSKIASKKKKKK